MPRQSPRSSRASQVSHLYPHRIALSASRFNDRRDIISGSIAKVKTFSRRRGTWKRRRDRVLTRTRSSGGLLAVFETTEVVPCCQTLSLRAGERAPRAKLSTSLCRLPELDAVPFRVPDPAEAAVVAVVLAFGIDADAGGGELVEQGVEVIDAKVHHELLGTVAEVIR